MARFGWANLSGSQAQGLEGSVQYKSGANKLAGSDKFIFDPSTGLVVTGNVAISGTLSANEYRVNVVDETITQLNSQGSSKFGNTIDDQHLFTGSLVITGASDSAFIYQVDASVYANLTSEQQGAVDAPGAGSHFFLTSSNPVHRGILNFSYESSPGVSSSVADDATFLRAINPALVVSGAAIFKDPISVQGGLFGASPIEIYAPLVFQRDDLTEESPDTPMKIEQGKFVGNVIISSSNDNHGLFMEGAGFFVMNSKKTLSAGERAPEFVQNNRTSDRNSYPLVAQRVFQAVDVAENPLFLHRRHSLARHTVGEQRWTTEFPILTGSDSSSAAHYQRFDFDVTRCLVQTDIRRNSNMWTLQTLDMNMDPGYEALDAVNSADRNISGSMVPIISSSHFSESEQNFNFKLSNVFSAGGFGNPGAGNIYGLKRGVQIFGNLIPAGWTFGQDAGFAKNFATKECTIGHPVSRWGDMYIHDDRYIRWGQTAGDNASNAFKRYYNSNPLTESARIDSGSVIFGYNSSSQYLVVSGAALFAENNINLSTSGYINFGTTKQSAGYGLRDNSGVIQVKSQAGDWQNITPTLQGVVANGNIATSPITASTIRLTGLSSGTATSSSFLALDSNNNIILTSSAGNDGKIGEAEDGSYADGLFVDFTSDFPVGKPIDRFNEVLKIIAPEAAPSLNAANYDTPAGQSAKLSFDSSNQITGYSNSSTIAGFSAVLEDGLYQTEISGSNFRLGIYDGTQDITGFLNYNTTASITNGNLGYTADAFGNAETGSLKLELNGTVVHTVDLSSFSGAGSPGTGSGISLLNTTGSGFTNISTHSSTLDGNGKEWYIFKYRTSKFKIDTLDQRKGWNYARFIHTIDSINYSTNYLEWINDPDGAGAALSVSNSRIEDVNLIGSKYVSGIQYNTDLTANYKADINNMYRNVYPNGNVISFNVSNSDPISVQALGSIADGEDETKIAQITGSINNNQILLLDGTITVSLNATHPLKSNLSSAGSVSLTGMLIDSSVAPPNSNLFESFINEDFRITSASYDTQGSVTAGAATWNSQTHMTGANVDGHQDGMLFYNRRLYSPRDADIAGVGNIASLANVSAGQPNYNTITGVRTFYRKIQNTSGGTIRDLKITSAKNGFKFSADTVGLDTNDSHFFVKIPGSTGFMNIREVFSYGSTSDGDGALINGASDNSNVGGVGNSVHCVTFGTQSVSNNEHVIIKIETNGMQGYISQLDFQLGASDVGEPNESLALDDIDGNNSGGNAKLSFGNSNVVSGYSSVVGSGLGSMSTIDSNGLYSLSGDRRGIFTSKPTFIGTLNEDVGSNTNYDANSFKNAYTGSLVLEVNGTDVHTVQLNNLNAISNNFNGNSSGFDLSAVSFSTTTDNVPDYTKPFRTGTYQVGPNDQNIGWNYVRVKHVIGGSTITTNYIEWVTDTNSNALAASSVTLSNFNHPDTYYQSGVGYFASRPSGSYTYEAANVYRNVYQNGTAVSFPTTNNSSISNLKISGQGVNTFDSSVASAALPDLNNTTDCEQQVIEVTGTVLFDNLTSISDGLGLFTLRNVSINSQVLHPFKSNLTTTTLSKNSFMVYSGSIGSTNLNTNEYFNTEDYRILSGNYANQASITNSSNKWNSQISINDEGSYPAYCDGLVTVNGFAISPLKIGNTGDTRNSTEGGSLQAPTGNPNYSVLTKDVRTIYRYFKNNSGGSSITPTITLYGDANLISKSGAFYTGTLGSNKNITVEIKVSFDPAFSGDDKSTAWADCIRPYSVGVQPTTDGVGVYIGGGSDLNQTVGGGGRSVQLQLQQSQIRNNQHFVVKISAHKDWTGYLSRINISY